MRESAQRLGVSGWTRNRDDGSVELEAEAGAEALEAFVAALRTGHPLARVTGLSSETVAATGEQGFEIRR